MTYEEYKRNQIRQANKRRVALANLTSGPNEAFKNKKQRGMSLNKYLAHKESNIIDVSSIKLFSTHCSNCDGLVVINVKGSDTIDNSAILCEDCALG